MVCGAVADRHDHHIGVMIVTSLSVAREREQGTPISYWFRRSPPGRSSSAKPYGVNCRHLPGHHCAGDWYLGVQIPFAGSLALFYFTMVIYGYRWWDSVC